MYSMSTTKKIRALVFLISAGTILANSLHVLVSWTKQPPDTYFTGIVHYFADYFLYISFMVQPSFVYTNHLFTNETPPPTWIYWLYTILGKFGNPFLVYNASIIVFSALLLVLLWHILRRIFTDQTTAVVAFLFLITASGFPGSDFWFSPFPALNRLGGVPHQILQTILLLLSLILFLDTKTGNKKSSQILPVSLPRWAHTLILSVVLFLAATSQPIQMLLVCITLILLYPASVVYLLPALAGALLVRTEFARNPILTAAQAWENVQQISVSLPQCILGLGPIVLFIPWGIRHLKKYDSPLFRALALYSGLSMLFFFLPLPAFLSTNAVRWLSPAAYTAFPLIAAIGWRHIKYSRNLLLAGYVTVTLFSLAHQIEARMNVPHALEYIPRNIVTSLTSLSGTGVVLTEYSSPYDVIVPAFTRRKTFTGHPIHTLYPDVKNALRRAYFSGDMPTDQKQQFLKDHGIDTIWTP